MIAQITEPRFAGTKIVESDARPISERKAVVKMRLDLVLPNQGPLATESLQAGAHFEAMGWDGLWLTDHVIGTKAYAARNPKYGSHWQEIMIAMAYVAAQTKRVRIGSGILVLPYRDPVLVAKMIATLDSLSGGRIDMGVGTGWARREFVALSRGDVFEDRGAYSDEMLDVMLACWKGGEIAFHGKWFDFERITFDPTPLQGDKVPIWVGGAGLAPAPLRRAAKYADYWHPTALSPEDVKIGGERLDEMAGRRVKRTVRFRCDKDVSEVSDLLHAYKDAGCVAVACAFDAPETFGEFDRKAEAVLSAAKALRD